MRVPMQQKLLEQGEHKYHCRFCDKTFSTGRALDGHMRTHNELFRQPDEGLSSTGAEGDCSNDGHRLPDGLSPPPPPLLTEEDQHLANCLVLLANAYVATYGGECSTEASIPISITEAEECSTSERKEIVDYIVVVPPPSPQPEVPPQISTETPPAAREIYKCKTCQKVFNSHQALGGHRASHKKIMGCFANQLKGESKPANIARYTTMEDEMNNQVGASSENMPLAIVPFGETSLQLPLPKQKSKVHECNICKRQFPSGQALGGHKRCHWSPSSSRAAAVVAAEFLGVATTELQVGNSSTEPLMFNSTVFSLDLNLPAPTDDFLELTLWVDMPTAMYVEPERENARENVLNVNLEEAKSREVRLTDLSDLMDMDEREGGSKWLQIGIGSISDQENGTDQP